VGVVISNGEAATVGANTVSYPVGFSAIDSRSAVSITDSLLDLRAIEQALVKSAFGMDGPDEVFDWRLIHVTYSAEVR
jgi:hypothetical protein